MFYLIEPEIAGGLGDHTEIDTEVRPPVVKSLEYRLEGWLGDELLESFPCFIVTESLAERIRDSKLSGFSLAPITVTTSPEFEELYTKISLPVFLWLKIKGQAEVDDFGLTPDFRLVASQRAMDTLSEAQINHADIEEYRKPEY